jgi:hypothetical protein
MTPSFFLTALASVALFGAVFADYLGNTNIAPRLLFAIFLGILAFGFIGIGDALSGTNWAFYAAINRDFAYQFKRAALFLALFFSPLIIISAGVNTGYLFIYLYAAALMMTFFISIGFLNLPLLALMVLLPGFIAITLYISYINPSLTLIMAAPAALLLVEARRTYYDSL